MKINYSCYISCFSFFLRKNLQTVNIHVFTVLHDLFSTLLFNRLHVNSLIENRKHNYRELNDIHI